MEFFKTQSRTPSEFTVYGTPEIIFSDITGVEIVRSSRRRVFFAGGF